MSFGKSSITRTKLFFAYSSNSFCWNTSALSLLHQIHQSLPVKLTSTALFSFFACSTAFSRLSFQLRLPADDDWPLLQEVNNKIKNNKRADICFKLGLLYWGGSKKFISR